MHVIDAANASAELNLDVEIRNLFDQIPVVTGLLVECRIEIDQLQPFGALADPFARAVPAARVGSWR